MLLASSALVASAMPAAAQDATWLATATVAGPTSGTFNFNAAANWNPASVPTGTAFFGTSTTTSLSFSNDTTVGGFTFNTGASSYTFINGNALTFNGAGIVVNGGSAAITNNASLLFFNSSTAGSATITNPGIIEFNNSSTAGSATITNTGNISFRNSSTAGSAAITNNNFLLFTDTSTAGNATITNNLEVDFFNSSTGGTARFINSVGATIDLSRLTTSGMTAGSIEGAGTIFLGSRNLAVGGNNLSTTFSGQISDRGFISDTGGSLTKEGDGTLTLSGINTYTGATTINAGTLQVDGSIASSSGVTVNAGATLSGIGTVAGTTIDSGGILAPGNGAPGTSLAISGSLAFQSGAIYLVQLNPSTASLVNVTGSATLAGNVQAVFASGSYVTKQYRILHADGGLNNTTFAGISTNFGAATLSYTNTDVFLNFTLLLGVGVTLNTNQQNVANAINSFFDGGGALPSGFAGLFNLSGPGLGAALTQVSGEVATGAQQTTFNAMNQFMGVLTDPFIAGRGIGQPGAAATGFADETVGSSARGRSALDAYAMFSKAPLASTYEPRWSVWAAGFGGSQTTDGNAALGSSDTTSRIFGTAVGADYLFSPNTIAGFALAGGGTNFSVANGGSGRSDLFQAGAFVRHNSGPAYVTAALAYGWQDITTDRTLTVSGIDRLRAAFNANAWSGRVEGGYRVVTPWLGGVGLIPYAAGQFTSFELPAYAESVVSGVNTFALTYNAKAATATRSELGLRTDKSFAMPDGIVTLRGRAAWAHDYNTDRNIAATFQTLPGASFVVNGARPAHDAALLSASAERVWLNGFSLAATFEGEFSDVTRSYAGKGIVRYQW